MAATVTQIINWPTAKQCADELPRTKCDFYTDLTPVLIRSRGGDPACLVSGATLLHKGQRFVVTDVQEFAGDGVRVFWRMVQRRRDAPAPTPPVAPDDGPPLLYG